MFIAYTEAIIHFASVTETDFPVRVLYRRARLCGLNRRASTEPQLDEKARFPGLFRVPVCENEPQEMFTNDRLSLSSAFGNLPSPTLSGAPDGRCRTIGILETQ